MNFLANPLYCILIVYVLGSLRRRSLLEGEGCLKKKKQFFFFWPCCIGIWDFSSQTRDRTCASCSGVAESSHHWTAKEVPILCLSQCLAQSRHAEGEWGEVHSV